MTHKMRIMIVDDNKALRDNIRKLLEFEPDMEVICEAVSGGEAIQKAKLLVPDIILMDVNMPEMDGISATEIIAGDMPQCLIIVISVQGEQEYFRKAMFAGAKDYLVKPFDGAELVSCIKQIYAREQRKREKFVQVTKEPGKVITIFSTKGGVGKTTLTTNLATALGLDEEKKIAIVDMDLQFGDVALFLNVIPKRTIADLVKDIDESNKLDGSILDAYLTKFKENIKVLAAPSRPEQADDVTASHIAAIIKELQYHYDYIVVDTAPIFNDIMFKVLDLSNMIMVATSQDLPTLKNVRLCLDILESLHYPQEKVQVVLNRANSLGGMNKNNSEDLLQRKLLVSMPSDGKTVVAAVNQGIPFVLCNPETIVAQTIFKLANYVTSGHEQSLLEEPPRLSVKGILSKATQLFKSDVNNKTPKQDNTNNKDMDAAGWSVY